MLQTFTQEEMLALWKRRYGLELLPKLEAIGGFGGVDARMLDVIRSWYSRVLWHAPVEHLPVVDIAARTRARRLDDNSAAITLPPEYVRFVSLKMQTWRRPVTRLADPADDYCLLQLFSSTAATSRSPVCVGVRSRITVFGLPPAVLDVGDDGPVIESLEIVACPPEGTYILDPCLFDDYPLKL